MIVKLTADDVHIILLRLTDCSQDQLMVTLPAVRQYITALQTSSQCLSIHTTHTVDGKMLKWKL